MQGWREVIWFVGAAVWLVVAALAVHHGSRTHALNAMVIAILLFGGGMFFSRYGKPRAR